MSTETTSPPAAGPIAREMLLWQAMMLPASDRQALADALWFSIDHPGGDVDDERYPLSPAWKAEIERRIAAVKAGDIEGIDVFESVRKLREKYSRSSAQPPSGF